jgi:hypothetical protein
MLRSSQEDDRVAKAQEVNNNNKADQQLSR